LRFWRNCRTCFFRASRRSIVLGEMCRSFAATSALHTNSLALRKRSTSRRNAGASRWPHG
jgi:hypothetical protein